MNCRAEETAKSCRAEVSQLCSHANPEMPHGTPVMRTYKRKGLYINNRTVMGMIWLFLIMVGGRGCGKTFTTQNYLLRRFRKSGRPCIWLRLKEPSCRKLLANNARDFFDAKLFDKWKLYDRKIEVKGNSIYIDDKEFCRIAAISTFYSDKGLAGMNSQRSVNSAAAKSAITKLAKKYDVIVCDEFNLERCEKRTMDVTYAFVNQLETICRFDTDRRIILLGNTLEEASDILAECFGFIPDKPGIYKLKNKKAVIWSIEDSKEYQKARAASIAGMLAPEESTFTNETQTDRDLLTTKPIGKQTQIIRFAGNKYFVLCGDVVTCQKPSDTTNIPTIAMRPYIAGYPYYKDRVKNVIDAAQQRRLKFDKLITLKLFYKEIKLLQGG